MRKIFNLILVIFLFWCQNSFAQYSFVKGNNVLEFSGALTGYYNYRFYPPGTNDRHNNSFALDFAELKVKGVYEKDISFDLEINFADLLLSDETRSSIDLGSDFIRQATVEYSGLRKYCTIKFGYDKVPFSRSSLSEYHESPFLQRGQIARGDVFTRRDVGVTLSREFVNRRLVLLAGAYTGLGEGSIGGENDASGKLEYVGRVEYSWHARYRYGEYDLEGSPIPVIAVGANAMYEEKKSSVGEDYLLQTIDGKKTGYGVDADLKYKFFTAHIEALQFRFDPDDQTRLLGYPTGYFMAGGFIASVNYYYKPFKSLFALRYDELNPNDLISLDRQKTISVAYNYLLNKTNACIKVHYWYRLKDGSAQPWTDNQLRIGYQLLF